MRERYVEITVADNGQGIAAEDLSRLFLTNVQYTRPGTAGERGTGLGLNLCRELVGKNGGSIGVESTLGEGTRFSFTLPRQVLTVDTYGPYSVSAEKAEMFTTEKKLMMESI